ncbi:MAG: hypothetical protein WBD40_00700 [Tepidisphaeraceae bacterium]
MRSLTWLTVFSLLAPIASAQTKPPATPAAEEEPAPLDVLKGRPDAIASGAGGADDAALGEPFESVAAGIKFRVPAGMKRAGRPTTPEHIVRYTDDARGWNLVAARSMPSRAIALSAQSAGEPGAAPGLLEMTRDQLKDNAPGAEVVREDVVTVGDYSVGMLAARFPVGLKRVLSQHAIIRADDRLYYTLSLTTPAARQRDDGTTPDDDLEERRAVEAFRAVVDTVMLLDRTPVLDDQRFRLYRSRALFVNVTPTRLRATLAAADANERNLETHGDGKGEQYLRILQDGKDVGYSYVVENEEKRGANDGLSVGARSRITLTPAPATQPADGANAKSAAAPLPVQTDSESLMWMSLDRKHETWRAVVVATENGKTRGHTTEIGASDRQTERVLDRDLPVGEKIDPRNPPVRNEDIYTLTVTTASGKVNAEPVTRSLPPFYLPQALAHLLPRLVPLNDPKTYMFASFVTDTREVMSRYIDVEREQLVTLDGKRRSAIPVRDRIGLDGSVTTHWMSPEGKYLGSTNDDTKVTILPSDAETLRKLWADAQLTAPVPTSAK